MVVTSHRHIRVLDSVVDATLTVMWREIYMPDVGKDGFQLSLIEKSRPIGILRIETDEQFNIFFDAIKNMSFYQDFGKMIPCPTGDGDK